MSVFRQYKSFRNEVSALRCDDALRVIWAYIQHLQIKEFSFPLDIEVDPTFLTLKPPQQWIADWDLEIVAKEIILNACEFRHGSQSLRQWDTLAAVMNGLKDLEERISGVHQDNIMAEINRIAHRQFVWQANRPNSTTLIRYYKIFNTRAIDQICIKRIGISVENIYRCGIAFLGAYLDDPMVKLPLSTDIKMLSESVINSFLSFTCRRLEDIRIILRSEQTYDTSFFYGYNSLRAFPLIRMKFLGHDSLVCPIPTLLFWRFTAGLFYELVNDPDFAEGFGESFQNYVGQTISRGGLGSGLCLLPEQNYGSTRLRKRSVDWIVHDDTNAIFLECKSKRLSWNAKVALDDLQAFTSDLGVMAEAIVQLYKTIGDYRRGEYPHLPFKKHRIIYPVVVTLENWHIFGPNSPKRLNDLVLEKLTELQIDTDCLTEMPYSVWYIGELETGIQVIQEIGIRAFMDKKITDPEMKRWAWDSYRKHMYRDKVSLKSLFGEEFDSITARMIEDN